MVYHNSFKQKQNDPAYSNDIFRAKHHYKEDHIPDPPQRKNRDFKPVAYGTFRGMPNFKHTEPFCLMKNLKEIHRDSHSMPIKWTKAFLYGVLCGGMIGYGWFIFKPL